MSPITMLRTLALFLACAFPVLAGCSSPIGEAGFNSTTGKHFSTWYTDHRVKFLENPKVCTDCHGADIKGGISGVSCFSANFSGLTCHANGPSSHPAGWASPSSHGALAKNAPNALTTSGFSACQICHGSDFAGGLVVKTCLNTGGCHGAGVMSPHPASWLTGTYTHINTDTRNAAVCALCHTNGANSPIAPPSPPAQAGTTPGCFNNSLCHGAAGHPAGWAFANNHGPAAKAAPNAVTMSGFSTCQSCHGNLFTGGVSNLSCLTCHPPGKKGTPPPHSYPWVTGSMYVHTTTDQGNAPVCALCHANGANSPIPPPSPPASAGIAPGCFNNTLCHALAGHTAGWANPAQHGANAKLAPNAATPAGFSVCQTCHGNTFTGGTSGQTCLRTVGCHGAGTNGTPPHAFPWSPDSTYRHNTTNQANAPVCALCHRSKAGTAGCFNSTLCHGSQN